VTLFNLSVSIRCWSCRRLVNIVRIWNVDRQSERRYFDVVRRHINTTSTSHQRRCRQLDRS